MRISQEKLLQLQEDFLSATDKTKLDSVSSGANANVNADWNQNDANEDSYIANKPTLAPSNAEANIQADWDEIINSSDAFILNKPNVAITSGIVDFMRTDTDDVQILPTGQLRIHLAVPNISGLTYGFTPNQFNFVDGMLPDDVTIALTGLDANHTAIVTDVTFIPANVGFGFSIASDGQSFNVTLDDDEIDVEVYSILPTVMSTEIGTGTVETNTTISIPFSVVAPTAAPVQSNYFYYGTTNVVATSGDDIDNLVVLVDQISNSLDSDGNGEARTGAGADYVVVRDRTDQGNKDITFTGQNPAGTLIEFIAIPASITPSFVELVDGHQYPAPFDADRIQGNAMINSVTYNIYKGVNDQGAEYIITF